MAQSIIALTTILLGGMSIYGAFLAITYNPRREIEKWVKKLQKERKEHERKLKMRLSPYNISITTIGDEVIGIATLPEGGSFRAEYRASKTRPRQLKLIMGLFLILALTLYLLLQTFQGGG